METLFFQPAKNDGLGPFQVLILNTCLHKAKPTSSEDCSLGVREKQGSRGFARLLWRELSRDVGYSQSFRVAASGSGVARLRVLDTLALALSRLLPRCSRLMCRTTAVALNACWRKTARKK